MTKRKQSDQEPVAVKRGPFEVNVHQFVELVIPNGYFTGYGRCDYRRQFKRDEAQDLAKALAAAALEIP